MQAGGGRVTVGLRRGCCLLERRKEVGRSIECRAGASEGEIDEGRDGLGFGPVVETGVVGGVGFTSGDGRAWAAALVQADGRDRGR